MKRPIAISLSPNTEKDDVLLAFKTFLSPVSWFNFRITEDLEKNFSSIFGKNFKAVAVNSGRSGLYLVLKSMGISRGDEVLIQALTCVAVPNAVLWNKATPVYVDVDDTFNIDVSDMQSKISKKTKAIIVQHSYGIPAQIEKIIKIARKHNILVIEDCALSLGAKYKNKLLGSFGDCAVFSFGRDKVLSSVFGGIVLVNDKKTYDKLISMRDKFSYPSFIWVMQQLLHPIMFYLLMPVYNTGYRKVAIGKILLFLMQKLKILSRAVYDQEKEGKQPRYFPQKMPGALSILAINQLNKLERYNKHRKKIAKYYFDNLKSERIIMPRNIPGSIWIRFPILVDDKDSIYKTMQKKNILLGDWYKNVVVPVKLLEKVSYEYGSCPKAEEYSEYLLNLPTYPTLTEQGAVKVKNNLMLCLNTK